MLDWLQPMLLAALLSATQLLPPEQIDLSTNSVHVNTYQIYKEAAPGQHSAGKSIQSCLSGGSIVHSDPSHFHISKGVTLAL